MRERRLHPARRRSDGDLCYDDVARFYLGECDTDDEDLPIRCDDYELATSCGDEGFDFQCGEIWARVDLPCG